MSAKWSFLPTPSADRALAPVGPGHPGHAGLQPGQPAACEHALLHGVPKGSRQRSQGAEVPGLPRLLRGLGEAKETRGSAQANEYSFTPPGVEYPFFLGWHARR